MAPALALVALLSISGLAGSHKLIKPSDVEAPALRTDAPRQSFRNQQVAVLEHSIMSLLDTNATPALKTLTEQIINMTATMKKEISNQAAEFQGDMDGAYAKFAECPQKSLDQSKSFLTEFNTKSNEHKTCRKDESGLATTHSQCEQTKQTALDAKKTECAAQALIEKESCQNPTTFCKVYDAEQCSDYLSRMAGLFETTKGNYASKVSSCSNKTQSFSVEEQKCTTTSKDQQTKRESCNTLQTEMDVASCNYLKETQKGCKSCFDENVASYGSMQTSYASKLEELRREYEVVLHMECLANSLGKATSAETKSAMSTCKATDYYPTAQDSVRLVITEAPTSPSCNLPDNTAGTSQYTSAQYDALPANAPAAQCACCTCDTHTCKDSTLKLKANPESIKGNDDSTCCEKKTCAQYTCPDGKFLKPDAGNIVGSSGLDSSLCCTNFQLTMSPCGAVGIKGPTQANCDGTYSSEYGVQVKNGAQILQVPASGSYQLVARGSKGGDHGSANGGSGSIITNTFDLQANDKLLVVVGQRGWSNPNNVDWGGGGGGATWVAKVVTSGGDDASAFQSGLRVETLLVAGGGSGPPDWVNSGTANGGVGLGGSPTTSSTGYHSGGGASLKANGRGGGGAAHHPSTSLLGGALGGSHSSRPGGFGGGGSPYNGGGGGGGYEGGNCESDAICQGGTCYSKAANPSVTVAGNAGPGSFTVTYIR